MKCPACFNELTAMPVGGVTVDVCRGGCGGVWFDAFELHRIRDLEPGATEWLFNIERDLSVQVDLQRKRECPRCAGVKLMRHYFSPQRRVEVDECPGCSGFWLDAGELLRVREETEETRFFQKARPAGLTRSVVRYLMRMKDQSPE